MGNNRKRTLRREAVVAADLLETEDVGTSITGEDKLMARNPMTADTRSLTMKIRLPELGQTMVSVRGSRINQSRRPLVCRAKGMVEDADGVEDVAREEVLIGEIVGEEGQASLRNSFLSSGTEEME